MPRARRSVAGTVLPVAVAAALISAAAPALCDGPGARTLGNSVLPPLPSPQAPEASEAPPTVPALSGTTGATLPQPAPPQAPEAPAAAQLAASRRDAIAAARRVQERERVLAAIRRDIDLLASDAEAGRRGLVESRAEQARLLGTVAHLASRPPVPPGPDDMPLIERLRGAALMRETDPVLRARLRALTGEIARLDALEKRLVVKKSEEAAAAQALAAERERLAAAVARRNALLRDMSPPQAIDAALDLADAERDATGIGDLIRRAEAAEKGRGAERKRGRTGGSRGKAAALPQIGDPTRPDGLRSLAQEAGEGTEPAPTGGRQQEGNQGAAPPHPLLVAPAAGAVAGERGAPDAPGDGLSVATVPGATVVAPFDGRIVYAGPFRNFGRVLIIRHDRRYYSALAGLGRTDAKLGDWVLAGEPVGAMPDALLPDAGAQAQQPEESDRGRRLYYELRRDGHPVDPQPWLAGVEDGHDERNGEQKVSQ